MNDVNEIIESWAYRSFKRTRAVSRREKRSNVVFDINWNSATWSTEAQQWRLTRGPSATQALYNGSYTNPTRHESQQMIKLDKETEAIFRLEITKGWTDRFPKPLLINLPSEITTATPAFGHSLQLDLNTKIFQTTPKIKWTVDSQIRNPAGSTTSAKVQVQEDVFEGTFSCQARLGGRVVVIGYRIQKPEKKFIVENDIIEAMKGQSGYDIDPVGKTVSWKIEGNCTFRFGVDHIVELS